jgi:CheY-like chemotaxis protein
VTADQPSITVLVADDDEDIRLLVRMVLQGAADLSIIEEAVDGDAALAAIVRLDPPPMPTVLLLDNRMPGLSGLEVAEQVLSKFPDQRIILFSAFLDEEIERRARAMGISACVAKADVGRLPGVISSLGAGG